MERRSFALGGDSRSVPVSAGLDAASEYSIAARDDRDGRHARHGGHAGYAERRCGATADSRGYGEAAGGQTRERVQPPPRGRADDSGSFIFSGAEPIGG